MFTEGTEALVLSHLGDLPSKLQNHTLLFASSVDQKSWRVLSPRQNDMEFTLKAVSGEFGCSAFPPQTRSESTRQVHIREQMDFIGVG